MLKKIKNMAELVIFSCKSIFAYQLSSSFNWFLSNNHHTSIYAVKTISSWIKLIMISKIEFFFARCIEAKCILRIDMSVNICNTNIMSKIPPPQCSRTAPIPICWLSFRVQTSNLKTTLVILICVHSFGI